MQTDNSAFFHTHNQVGDDDHHIQVGRWGIDIGEQVSNAKASFSIAKDDREQHTQRNLS